MHKLLYNVRSSQETSIRVVDKLLCVLILLCDFIFKYLFLINDSIDELFTDIHLSQYTLCRF